MYPLKTECSKLSQRVQTPIPGRLLAFFAKFTSEIATVSISGLSQLMVGTSANFAFVWSMMDGFSEENDMDNMFERESDLGWV